MQKELVKIRSLIRSMQDQLEEVDQLLLKALTENHTGQAIKETHIPEKLHNNFNIEVKNVNAR